MNNALAAFYDRQYAANPALFNREVHELFSQLLQWLIPGNALDVGAGQGRYALTLGQRCWKVDAIDISERAVSQITDRATKEYLPVIASRQDIREFTPQEEYDLVVCTFLLHHFSYQETAAVLTKLQGCTKPGGYHFLITFLGQGTIFNACPSDRFLPADLAQLMEWYPEKQWEWHSNTAQVFKTCVANLDSSPGTNLAAVSIIQRI